MSCYIEPPTENQSQTVKRGGGGGLKLFIHMTRLPDELKLAPTYLEIPKLKNSGKVEDDLAQKIENEILIRY